MPVQQGVLDPLDQFSVDNSQAGIGNTQNPVVIVGQAFTAQPFTLYPCTSGAQANGFAGQGSHLARMFKAYFSNDTIGPIYLLPYPDAAGASPAVGNILLNGTATANGTLFIYMAGQLVQVGVPSGTTAVQAAALAVAAINANLDSPVVALAVAAADTTLRKIQLTARNAGTLGNLIDLRLNYGGAAAQQALPAGISATVVAMAGGATDPDMTQVASVLADQPCRLLIHPYARNSVAMAAFASLMSDASGRWSPLRGSLGHCFTAYSDLPSNLEAYGPTNNDQHSCIWAFEAGSPTPEWEAAAMWAGSQAATFRQQPNLPTTGNPLNGFLPPPVGLPEASGGAFMKTTRNTLMGMGLGTAKYPVGGPVVNRAPTTYQSNSFGAPDQSYFDTQTMFTLMRIQDYIGNWETQVFANTLVADDGTSFGPGIRYTTPKLFLAGMVDLYTQMEFAGLVEDAAPFIAASTVARNLQYPGELDVLWAPYLISGLYQITNTIQFRNYSAVAAAAAASAASAGAI
jgi:phage tail sheath gpL-like